MARSSLSFRWRWQRRLRALGWTAVLLAMLLGLWLVTRPPPSSGAMLFAADGDSLVIRVAGSSRGVRLIGIDAPERGQRCRDARGAAWDCGRAATAALRALVPQDAPLTCHSSGTDRFDRALSVCLTADGRDVAAQLVAGGWAIATTETYLVEEAEARAARRGLWAGDFETPAEWRAAHPRK
jgi:endonuclease YncB( thermonuclease family)